MMTNQLVLKIDEKRTKKAIEKLLIKYREYLLTLPYQYMPKITASYSLVPPSNTNEFNSQTEDVAIERVAYELARNSFMNKIHEALEMLKVEEKKIIVESYLLEETIPDVEIWTDLNIGKTKFYKNKWQALLRLAFVLKVEVYEGRR